MPQLITICFHFVMIFCGVQQQQFNVFLPLYYQCLIKPLNIKIFIVEKKKRSFSLHSYTRTLRALLLKII